jgi:transposase InsO family protein
MVTLAHIKEQSRLSLGSYGRPRMTEELKEIGLNIGHRSVGRLMRQNGISVVRTRKHKVTTDSNHKFNIAPNLLDRNFAADGPNQKWAGDITYIWTREGWLYLAVILDLHSRRVIGWAVSNRMKRDLAIRALKMAIAFRAPPKGCIHHTDRGSQYCSHDYQKILRQHSFKVSMSGKGGCYDNAVFVKGVVRRFHAASLISGALISFSGFNQTGPAGCQFRVFPDQRCGFCARAVA